MVLTGGAAAALAESLGPSVCYVPYLTLAGIVLADLPENVGAATIGP
jgi:hypothetical protein